MVTWIKGFLRRQYHILQGTIPNTRVQHNIPNERLGSDYGGWVIKVGSVNRDSIVYSFGIGTDITFDEALIEKYGPKIYAFDPTPRVKDWLDEQQLSPLFVYDGVAVAAEDGAMRFYTPANPDHISHSFVQINEQGEYFDVPAKRLKTIMDELGHDHIDVLKIDIEGAEYAVIKNIVENSIRIDQLLVEFHHFFPAFKAKDTQDAVDMLNRAGYKIFSISPSGHEYSFIRVK